MAFEEFDKVKKTPAHTPTTFGTALKMFRERKGVSQSKLSETAECDHSYISRLESGARMPTREAVFALGQSLHLKDSDIDILFAAAGFMPVNEFGLIKVLPELKDLDDALSTASETDKLSVTFTVRLLIDFLRRGQ